jgi:hypothetical protein
LTPSAVCSAVRNREAFRCFNEFSAVMRAWRAAGPDRDSVADARGIGIFSKQH